MVIGILALQGCVEPHAEKLRGLGAEVRSVRKAQDLEGLAGLILPGGESTTIARLIHLFELEPKLRELSQQIPFWGVCAGSILMAKTLRGTPGPFQIQLGLVRATVERNSYGRQLESFYGEIEPLGESRVAATTQAGDSPGVELRSAPFIRAPQFIEWDSGVEVRARCNGEVVSLKDGIHIISSFHPELSDSDAFHREFLDLCERTSHRNREAPPPASI